MPPIAAAPQMVPQRWQLTAPESHVLLHGQRVERVKAFKVALAELLARGRLRQIGGATGRLLAVRDNITPLPPPLQVVWDLVAAIPGAERTGVPLSLVGKAAMKRWGNGVASYPVREVMPQLRARGIYGQESYRILGFIPASREVLTAEGKRARAELVHLQHLAQQGEAGWQRVGIAGAAGFVALAGAAIFLFDTTPDILQQVALERARAMHTGASSYDTSGTSDWSEEEAEPHDLPGAGGDFGSLPDFDWGNLDGLSGFDSAFDSFDSLDLGSDSGDSSSDSGGDSGGDGGGGSE